jgi:HEAT repeat protein
VPALILTLKDPVVDVREEAARALGLMQVFADDAVPPLVETLKDDQARVRRQAAESLGQIGWPARDAAPALVLGLQDEDASVRAAAAHSLGVIQSRRDRRHSAILDRSRARRQQTITPIAEDAVPALSRALADSSARVRQQAAQALGMFGEAGFFDVVSELIRALHDMDKGVRISAISSLGRIGPKAAKAIPALEHALQDAYVTVRTEAAKALKRVKPEAPPRYVGPGA